MSNLKSEGQNRLQNAQNAANRLGDRSQQLSEFAEQANSLVTKQEDQRSEIEKFADSAAANSKKALNEANEAIFGASTTSQQIDTLKNQVEQTTNSFEQIKQIAEQVNAEAKDAHNQAALALSSVEGAKVSFEMSYSQYIFVQFPDVVPDDLNEEAQNQREESSLSATDAKEKIEENRQTLDDARMALAGAHDDLRVARDQQEVKINV